MGYHPETKNNVNQRGFDGTRQGQSYNQTRTFKKNPQEIQVAFDKMSKDYGSFAEDVILKLNTNKKDGKITMTTNQIRNILSMLSTLYNTEVIKSGALDEKVQNDLKYLKIKLAYASGRDSDNNLGVKDFIQKSNLYDFMDCIKDDRQAFLLLCRYVEALVAYHKYHGGKN